MSFSLAFHDLLVALAVFGQLQASPAVAVPGNSPELTKVADLLRQIGESPQKVLHLLVPHALGKLVTSVGLGLGGYWLLKWELRGRRILLLTSLLAAFNSVFGLYPTVFLHWERTDLLAQMMDAVAQGRLSAILKGGVQATAAMSLGFTFANTVAAVGFSAWAWVYLRRPEFASLLKPSDAPPL